MYTKNLYEELAMSCKNPKMHVHSPPWQIATMQLVACPLIAFNRSVNMMLLQSSPKELKSDHLNYSIKPELSQI